MESRSVAQENPDGSWSFYVPRGEARKETLRWIRENVTHYDLYGVNDVEWVVVRVLDYDDATLFKLTWC